MKSLRILQLVAIVFIMNSCDQERKPSMEVNTNTESVRKDASAWINELKEIYPIDCILDTIEYEFSYQYDKVLHSQFVLIDYGELIDIFRDGDDWYVKMIVSSFPSFYVKLHILPNASKSLDQLINSEIYGRTIVRAICKLNTIRKFDAEVSATEDNESSLLYLRASDHFVVDGELVEILDWE